jgi:hypothetical protein
MPALYEFFAREIRRDVWLAVLAAPRDLADEVAIARMAPRMPSALQP